MVPELACLTQKLQIVCFFSAVCSLIKAARLSNVHLRFKRLLFGGCTSGSMRGFVCESRAVRWVAVRSRKTMRTFGMCRSEWRVWLETCHGALVIDLRSLDWYHWVTAMLDLVAHPHSSFPYVHIFKMEIHRTHTLFNIAPVSRSTVLGNSEMPTRCRQMLWFMAEASYLLQLVTVVLKKNFRVKFSEGWQLRVSQAFWVLSFSRKTFQHLLWQEWVFSTRFAGYYHCDVLSFSCHRVLIFQGRGLRPNA